MTKTVKIRFSTTDEIKEIIAKYAGVTADKVGLGRDDDGNFFSVVEKELTFPEEKQDITSPYSPWYVPTGIDYPNPLKPYVTWTSSDAKCVTDTGIRAKWTKDDALATSETSKANDWK